jgi:flagellar biogenesis protein FliO
LRIVRLWNRVLRLGRRAPRRLRLAESLPLGEHRFVAVVEFEQWRFLLGGTASSLVLLARLAEKRVISRRQDGQGT